jgi:hypothetical protein
MKRLAKILATGALVIATVALADRTVTLLTSAAKVDTMTFRFQDLADGGTDVSGTVCGHTTLQSGGDTGQTCWPTGVLPVANTTRVDAMTLRTTRATVFWRTQEGL